jgi:isopenicillin N synthase-like dioxygenase
MTWRGISTRPLVAAPAARDGAILVNVGDMLQRWTAGVFRSVRPLLVPNALYPRRAFSVHLRPQFPTHRL